MKDREIRAAFTEKSITVYQAFSAEIADNAIKAGTFVSPFKLERMTWIKPSFLWMMYRSRWATKPGQERVLAIDISREGFEWALANSTSSSYNARFHGDYSTWQEQLVRSPVRIQWDPERDIFLNRLPFRSIQIGLRGIAVRRYLGEWIQTISDISEQVLSVRGKIDCGLVDEARKMVPIETRYPVPPGVAEHLLIASDL